MSNQNVLGIVNKFCYWTVLRVKINTVGNHIAKVNFTLEQTMKAQMGSKNYTLSFTLAQDGGGGDQRDVPATVPRQREQAPIVQEMRTADYVHNVNVRFVTSPKLSDTVYLKSLPHSFEILQTGIIGKVKVMCPVTGQVVAQRVGTGIAVFFHDHGPRRG